MNGTPNDLIPAEQAPADLQAAPRGWDDPRYAGSDPVNRALAPVTSFMQRIGPSPTARATMAIPGAGLGPIVARILTAGAGQAGETAADQNARQDYSGEHPAMAGAKGAAWQGAVESLPFVGPVAGRVLDHMPVVGPVRVASRAVSDLSKSLKPTPPPAAAPGEYMGKYGPTGIPASTILGPNGQPARAAVNPQVIPHKDLRGWTLLDVLNQTPAAASKAYSGVGDYLRTLLKVGATGVTQDNLSPGGA